MLHQWLLLLHLAGVFWFVAGHGVSVILALKLRREHRMERIRAYLEVSRAASRYTTGPGALLLGGTGLALAIKDGWFSAPDRDWLWLSIALFVVAFAVAAVVVIPSFRHIRRAVAQSGDAPLADPSLRLLLARNPSLLAGAAAGAAFIGILYLMIFRPW